MELMEFVGGSGTLGAAAVAAVAAMATAAAAIAIGLVIGMTRCPKRNRPVVQKVGGPTETTAVRVALHGDQVPGRRRRSPAIKRSGRSPTCHRRPRQVHQRHLRQWPRPTCHRRRLRRSTRCRWRPPFQRRHLRRSTTCRWRPPCQRRERDRHKHRTSSQLMPFPWSFLPRENV